MKTSRTTLRITAFVLIAAPILLVLLRYQSNELATNPWVDLKKHRVEYHFDLHGNGQYQINSFLPGNDARQQVAVVESQVPQKSDLLEGNNHKISIKGNLCLLYTSRCV